MGVIGDISEYGIKLFNYFCDNKQKIIFYNFTLLPPRLQAGLFIDEGQSELKQDEEDLEEPTQGEDELTGDGDEYESITDEESISEDEEELDIDMPLIQSIANISLHRITTVFTKLEHLSLNQLNLHTMDCDALDYVDNILAYIESAQKAPHGLYSLKKITLQSEKQTHIKESSTLSKIAKKGERNDIAYRKYQWEIHYERTPDLKHTLVFTKGTKQKLDKMESMVQLLVTLDKMVRNEKVDWRGHQNDEIRTFAKTVKQLQRDETGEVSTDGMDVSLARLFIRNLSNLQSISIPNL
eukprot:237798_1